MKIDQLLLARYYNVNVHFLTFTELQSSITTGLRHLLRINLAKQYDK